MASIWPLLLRPAPATPVLTMAGAAGFARERRWAVTGLGVFVLAQLVGVFLRLLPLWPQPVNYTHLLYGHTHVALTGWVQALFYLALMRMLPETARRQKAYAWIWYLNLLGTLGMLIAFPLQGYKATSIALSSGVILVSYAFAWRLWRDSRSLRHQPAWRCARYSLGFLLLSSLGPWSLGILMARQAEADTIRLAVYYYLHFLYNGFFGFALLAVLLHWGSQARSPLKGPASAGTVLTHERPAGRFWPVTLLALATLPAYALSALWTNPPVWVWGLAWLAAGLQLLALAGLLPTLAQIWRQLSLAGWSRALLAISLLCLAARLLMQALSALPALALPLASNRYLIIAYLHLVFLGFLSCFLFAWLIDQGLLRRSHPGLGLFLAGAGLSEAWLFAAGGWAWLGFGALPVFPLVMALASSLMPLGCLWLLWRQTAAPLGRSRSGT